MKREYENAIKELEKMLDDARRNRTADDPEEKNDKWDGFVQGIEGAIYRLEMQT